MNILNQFANLKLSKFEIVLQSNEEAVLPALIGSTLRGAFGHALKAIACSVQHQDCDKCFLSEVCLYPTVFEPTSNSRAKDIPRPFVFEPPVPPFTPNISKTKTLQIYVKPNGKISFGLTLIGDTVKKLPYFIYAFELMARHGLGATRQPFSISEVFQIDEKLNKTLIYDPTMEKIKSIQENTLKDFVEKRLEQIKPTQDLFVQLQTPLRFRHKRKLLKKITFTEFFKRCSLRLKLLSENYGTAFEYDYLSLLERSKLAKSITNKIWRHSSIRRSNRQNLNLDLDGYLGNLHFVVENPDSFFPFICAGEFINVGSSCGLGLGKYTLK